MRMTTATTAFKMPLYGIYFPLSAFSAFSTFFRNSEKMSCANDNALLNPYTTPVTDEMAHIMKAESYAT